MSIYYIIEELEKISDIPTRVKELERLVPRLHHSLPSGHYNPISYYNHASDKEWLRYFDQEKKDFLRVFELCEYNIAPAAARLYTRWMRNMRHSIDLMKFSKENLRDIKLIDLFPYWDDFDRQVHDKFKYARSDIDISRLKFDGDFIAKGGFGEIYYVADPDSNKTKANVSDGGYVLKLFYPDFLHRPGTVIVNKQKSMRLIRNNIVKQMEKNSLPDAFIKVHSYASLYNSDYTTEWAYIADYFDGKNVFNMVTGHDPRLANTLKGNELKGMILLTYAQTMKRLHDERRLFMDSSLDSILVHNSDPCAIKICDPDMVTYIEDISDMPSDFKYPRHEIYSSQEHFLYQTPTYSSDLESFALMIHHLLLGECFMKQDDFDKPSPYDISSNRKSARLNIRKYDQSFIRQLPKNIGELLNGMISYPKKEKIKADDFVNAIKSDFLV